MDEIFELQGEVQELKEDVRLLEIHYFYEGNCKKNCDYEDYSEEKLNECYWWCASERTRVQQKCFDDGNYESICIHENFRQDPREFIG